MDTHLPEYELYAIRYAERDARRSAHFIGGGPHHGPLPLDYFRWVATTPPRGPLHWRRRAPPRDARPSPPPPPRPRPPARPGPPQPEVGRAPPPRRPRLRERGRAADFRRAPPPRRSPPRVACLVGERANPA